MKRSNLGLLVKVAICLIVATVIVREVFLLRQNNNGATATRIRTNHLRGSDVWVTSESQPFAQDQSTVKNLVIVAGHSVIVSGNLEAAGKDESVWWLLDYQRGRGMPEAIMGHIRAGIDEANRDPEALLVFSGGQTRPLTGPLSEGTSYFAVADANQLWPAGSTVRARTTVEEYATDSFQNLLFSICRFKEVTGSYPQHITMVSFTFKEHRFKTLHAPALQWPTNHFHYIGYDPPSSTGFDLQLSTRGEHDNAAKPFESDPYGCNSIVLQEKRLGRNPFHRTAPYPLSCPAMTDLLNYCGPEIIASNKVPW